MPLKEIANTDRIITITPGGGWVPGIPNYIPHLSTKVKANAKQIIVGVLPWTMAGCQLPPSVFVSGGGSIVPTATKTKEAIFGECPLRKDDMGTCNGSFIFFGFPTNCTCSFQITNAGQSKVKCD
jgi:hypothetical protein